MSRVLIFSNAHFLSGIQLDSKHTLTFSRVSLSWQSSCDIEYYKLIFFLIPGPSSSILKIKCYQAPGQRRRPTAQQTSFSDWVMSEGQNLRQNGSVYRVSQNEAAARNKSVRFNDKNTPLTAENSGESPSGPTPVIAVQNKPSGRLTTFTTSRHRIGETIMEEPETNMIGSNEGLNSLQFIPQHQGPTQHTHGWNDGSLV